MSREEVIAEKDALRREMRQRRRDAESAWVVAASRRIQDAVMARPEFAAARSLACYMAMPYEVQTGTLLAKAWAQDKRVCVPAFNETTRRYELVWVTREDRTSPGRWNIQEPEHRSRAGLMDVDLLIVPALAYGRDGGRLGHGGGHYDRILGSWSGLKMGVAFDFQVFDQVPMGHQDVPVDLVITELGTYGEAG